MGRNRRAATGAYRQILAVKAIVGSPRTGACVGVLSFWYCHDWILADIGRLPTCERTASLKRVFVPKNGTGLRRDGSKSPLKTQRPAPIFRPTSSSKGGGAATTKAPQRSLSIEGRPPIRAKSGSLWNPGDITARKFRRIRPSGGVHRHAEGGYELAEFTAGVAGQGKMEKVCGSAKVCRLI